MLREEVTPAEKAREDQDVPDGEGKWTPDVTEQSGLEAGEGSWGATFKEALALEVVQEHSWYLHIPEHMNLLKCSALGTSLALALENSMGPNPAA